MNPRPFLYISFSAQAEATDKDTQAIILLEPNHHGETTCFKTFVPCSRVASFGCHHIIIIILAKNKINFLPHQLEVQHYSTSTVHSILNFTPVLGLAVNCFILREAMIDQMASLSESMLAHGVFNTDAVGKTEAICLEIIELVTKLSTNLHLGIAKTIWSLKEPKVDNSTSLP